MKKNYNMVIFDVDGTLLDTREGILSSVVYTMQNHGLPVPDEAALLSFIGPPVQVSFTRQYGLTDPKEAQKLTDTFRRRYSESDLTKAVPYPGMYDLFSALQAAGITPAVATYKRQDYAEAIVRHFGFDAYTDVIYGADNENRLKKKDIIALCLSRGGVSPERALMVGDSDNDAVGASDLGLDFLGVTYGFGFHTAADVRAFDSVGVAGSAADIAAFLGLSI